MTTKRKVAEPRSSNERDKVLLSPEQRFFGLVCLQSTGWSESNLRDSCLESCRKCDEDVMQELRVCSGIANTY
jgi:hypothetical protein